MLIKTIAIKTAILAAITIVKQITITIQITLNQRIYNSTNISPISI
jgi:hypothetical protein